jgi:hypothetical protein
MLVNDEKFRALEICRGSFMNHADLMKLVGEGHDPECQTYLEALIYIQEFEVDILKCYAIRLQRLNQS